MIMASIESLAHCKDSIATSAAATQRSLLQTEPPATLRAWTPAIATTFRTSSCENSEVSLRLSTFLSGTQVATAAILGPFIFVNAIYLPPFAISFLTHNLEFLSFGHALNSFFSAIGTQFSFFIFDHFPFFTLH